MSHDGPAPTVHRPVDLLWTSGWDSTYRLLQLLKDTDVVVRPWYVLDQTRASLGREIRTMSVLRAAIRERDPRWADRILPTQFRARDEIPPAPEITALYDRFKQKVRTGPQYEWLARLARAEGLDDVELGLQERPGGICSFVAPHVRPVEALGRTVLRLVEHPSDPDVELFRSFSFPLLDRSKLEMQRDAHESGLDDLMEKTWFCFRPHRGQPCGRCHPCQVALLEGMGRRMPLWSRVRGRLRLARRAVAKPLRGH